MRTRTSKMIMAVSAKHCQPSRHSDILQPGRCWKSCGRGCDTFILEDCERLLFCETVCEMLSGIWSYKILTLCLGSLTGWQDKYLLQVTSCLTRNMSLSNLTDMYISMFLQITAFNQDVNHWLTECVCDCYSIYWSRTCQEVIVDLTHEWDSHSPLVILVILYENAPSEHVESYNEVIIHLAIAGPRVQILPQDGKIWTA